MHIVVRIVIMIALQLFRAASGSQNAHSVYAVMLFSSIERIYVASDFVLRNHIMVGKEQNYLFVDGHVGTI